MGRETVTVSYTVTSCSTCPHREPTPEGLTCALTNTYVYPEGRHGIHNSCPKRRKKRHG